MKPKREPASASPGTVNAVLELARDIHPTDQAQADLVATYVLAIVEREVSAVLRRQNALHRDLLRQNREACERAVTEAYQRGRQELLAGSHAAN